MCLALSLEWWQITRWYDQIGIQQRKRNHRETGVINVWKGGQGCHSDHKVLGHMLEWQEGSELARASKTRWAIMKAHKNNNGVLESQYKYCSQWRISYQIRDIKPLIDTNDKKHIKQWSYPPAQLSHFFPSHAKLKYQDCTDETHLAASKTNK